MGTRHDLMKAQELFKCNSIELLTIRAHGLDFCSFRKLTKWGMWCVCVCVCVCVWVCVEGGGRVSNASLLLVIVRTGFSKQEDESPHNPPPSKWDSPQFITWKNHGVIGIPIHLPWALKRLHRGQTSNMFPRKMPFAKEILSIPTHHTVGPIVLLSIVELCVKEMNECKMIILQWSTLAQPAHEYKLLWYRCT